MKLRRALLVAAAATFASCIGYGRSNQDTPGNETLGSGSSVVRRVEAGLATQMRTAARALERGQRYVATDALNRARHLADAGAFDDALDPNRREQLRDAYDSIERARHRLQNGNEDGAREALTNGAYALERIEADGCASSTDPERGLGLMALDSKGRMLGKVVDVRAEDDSVVVSIRHGGFLGLGAERTTMRVRGLLVGRHYAAISRAGSRLSSLGSGHECW